MNVRVQHSVSKGFTLIELLVVIAIIAVLAVITLDYMGASKEKSSDAGVKQNLVNARSQAEVFYANNNRSYLNLCNDTGTGIFRQLQAAARAHGITPRATYVLTDAGAWNRETCHSTVDAYAVWIPLKSTSFGASRSGTPVGLCIDSRNTTRIVNSDLPASQTFCP